MRIASLDHLVLTVANPERTVAFYTRVLGMECRTFGAGRLALHFGEQKINLHQAGVVVDKNVRHAALGSADLCFLTEASMDEILSHLAECGVAVIQGPVRRTGAQGAIDSVYVYDPDENLLEIARRLEE